MQYQYMGPVSALTMVDNGQQRELVLMPGVVELPADHPQVQVLLAAQLLTALAAQAENDVSPAGVEAMALDAVPLNNKQRKGN